MDIFTLGETLKALTDHKKALNASLKDLNEQIDDAETQLIEAMMDEDVPSFTRGGFGYSLVIKNYPSAVPERKDELYDELKNRGYEHLFTINSQTLASTLKEFVSENDDEFPEWLEGLAKPFEKASIKIRKAERCKT